MANDEQRSEDASQSWLSKRAGVLILVVIGAIVVWRLMSTWLRWLLFAIVIATIVGFARRWLGEREAKDEQ